MDQTVRALLERDLQAFEPAWHPGHPGARAIFERFVRIVTRRAEDASLAQRPRQAILLELEDSLRFIAVREARQLLVRVFDPATRDPGATDDRTVIETCTADQPFLVDTLRLTLRRAGIRERFCHHPILAVKRDAAGLIEDLGEPPGGGSTESFIHFDVDPVDPARHAEVVLALERVLALARTVYEDFSDMVKEARNVIVELDYDASRFRDRQEQAKEASDFAHWLIADRFVFLGYRSYDVADPDGEMAISLRPGSGLGIGRDERRSRYFPPKRGGEIRDSVRVKLLDESLVLVEKANADSPIHRPGKIDYVTVKRLSRDGKLEGFCSFFGLFTHAALEEPGSEVPVLRQKLKGILASEGATSGSHLYKETVAAFDSIPLEYLFLSTPEEIRQDIHLISAAQARNEIGLNVNRSPWGRSVLVVLVLPPGKYSEELRAEVERRLTELFHANYSDHRVAYTEVEAAVLHFYFTTPEQAIPEVDPEALLAEIRALTQSWEDLLCDALKARFGEAAGADLTGRYGEAFPEPYRVARSAQDAAADIGRLERVRETGWLQASLDRTRQADGTALLLLRLYGTTRIHLADSMPVLDHLGLRVVNQVPTEVRPGGAPPLFIDSFQIEDRWAGEEELSPRARLLEEALRAVFRRDVDDDPLNRLVLTAGLGWRQVDVFRAYVGYTQQIGSIFSRDFHREVLIGNPSACSDLFALFDARFNPAIADSDRTETVALRNRLLEETLRRVESFNEDRALRTFWNLIESTLRTNFYRERSDPYFLTIKLDGAKVENLPLPRPAYELVVRGPQMEGVHLRKGKVARGGIRWSDRLDDYRSEILGLMKTQHVKNALIVPVGAKGGFILKARGLARADERKLADARYEIFIRGLLDVTDNLVDGRIARPDRVVAWDGDDPYLVVAADKGTAHLSDTANRIAQDAGFWLGDAFASGGSHGYDHKKEGITARGAWTCVRRHFLEMGVNLDEAPIRVAGIGDMSGDVFGNGMLLSRRMKLVGAFDHRHVFLDPDPDPEKSFIERQRLFGLPGSSWDDYDRSILSPGGGVFRRSAKSIPLSSEVRSLLGVTAEALGGEQVIAALLRAEVDLLYNGGIGTYIKAGGESHRDVGDKANDRVRVDAAEVRAKVIGEGGNLGVTQQGRIELALRGVRINSDALDNSAGVDLSDHEVNLKIGFQPFLRAGKIDFEERNRLLEEIKAVVCGAVTAHNWSQSRCLSLDALRSRRGIEEFMWLLEGLEREGELDRAEEALPGTDVLGARRDKGLGLTRPELAVLLGYAKLDFYYKLAASDLLDAPAFLPFFDHYFPEAVRRLDPGLLRGHRLRREITATMIANHIVDWAGVCFFREMMKETGREPAEIAAAYVLAESVLDGRELKRDLEATGFKAPIQARYTGYMQVQDTLEESTRWVLTVLGSPESWSDIAGDIRATLERMVNVPEDILGPVRRAVAESRTRELREQGLPEDLARRVVAFRQKLRWVAIGQIAREAGDAAGWSVADVARLYYAIGEATQLDWMLLRMSEAPKPTEWDKIAYGNLRAELIRKQRAIAVGIISGSKPSDGWDAAWDEYRRANARCLERLAQSRTEVEAAPTTRFTPFSVMGQMVKSLP